MWFACLCTLLRNTDNIQQWNLAKMVTYNIIYMDHKFTYWLQYSNRKVVASRIGGVRGMHGALSLGA